MAARTKTLPQPVSQQPLILVSLCIIAGLVAYLLLTRTSISSFSSYRRAAKTAQETVLSSEFYIGPRPYKLSYEYQLGKRQARMWLVGTSDENERYLLMEEEPNLGTTLPVVYSPSHRRFIVTRRVGDYTEHILMGVETKDDKIVGISPAQKLPLQDEAGKSAHRVLSWIDEETILFATDFFDAEGKVTRTTHTKAPVSDLSAGRVVNLK